MAVRRRRVGAAKARDGGRARDGLRRRGKECTGMSHVGRERTDRT